MTCLFGGLQPGERDIGGPLPSKDGGGEPAGHEVSPAMRTLTRYLVAPSLRR